MTYLFDGHPLEDSPLASCRSCADTIVWAVVQASGKRIPLNPQPAADGNLAVTGFSAKGVPFITYDRGQLELGEEPVTDDRYVTHFATCPNARRHRRS